MAHKENLIPLELFPMSHVSLSDSREPIATFSAPMSFSLTLYVVVRDRFLLREVKPESSRLGSAKSS